MGMTWGVFRGSLILIHNVLIIGTRCVRGGGRGCARLGCRPRVESTLPSKSSIEAPRPLSQNPLHSYFATHHPIKIPGTNSVPQDYQLFRAQTQATQLVQQLKCSSDPILWESQACSSVGANASVGHFMWLWDDGKVGRGARVTYCRESAYKRQVEADQRIRSKLGGIYKALSLLKKRC